MLRRKMKKCQSGALLYSIFPSPVCFLFLILISPHRIKIYVPNDLPTLSWSPPPVCSRSQTQSSISHTLIMLTIAHPGAPPVTQWQLHACDTISLLSHQPNCSVIHFTLLIITRKSPSSLSAPLTSYSPESDHCCCCCHHCSSCCCTHTSRVNNVRLGLCVRTMPNGVLGDSKEPYGDSRGYIRTRGGS
jgi:hypothetical protein